MLSLNLRRGLFRVWIVASFVWVISAGVVLQKDIRREVSRLMTDIPAEITQSKTLPTLPPGFVLDAPPDPFEAYPPAITRPLTIEEVTRLRRERDQAPQEVAEERETDDGKKTRKQVRSAPRALMIAGSVLVLPPILAFALGWSGLWIMRGFRR